MDLTKELYEFIERECKVFEEKYNYDVDQHDVIFSCLYSTDDVLWCLNDWDEGEYNDPHWNKELNKHCVEVFLKEMVEKVKNWNNG